MSKQLHKDQLNTLLNNLEKRFVGPVYKTLRKQYSSFIKDIENGGVDYARRRISTTIANVDIGKVIERIHRTAGIYMANKTLSALKRINANKVEKKAIPINWQCKYAVFGFNAEWVAEILEYFRQHLLEKVVIGVSNTTRARLLEILDQATANGWSNDQIVDKLNDLEEIRNRARKIVRTETVKAANYGVLLGADKYDFEVVKEWISIPDNRRRHSHALVDSQLRELTDKFSNGLYFPGDPNGEPGEVINCRCSLTIIPKRDEDGRLIPKKKDSPIIPFSNRLAA